MMSVLPTDVSADLSAMVAQVASDRENAKMEIATLRRDMDLYRRQAKTLLNQGYSADNFQKFRGHCKNFAQEVGLRVGRVGELEKDNGDESYTVLRGSLSEAQKRCENLNENMLMVADANGDLLHTLGSLKNANKRLVEQLEQQSGELSSLEQQAVLGEEKLMNSQYQQEEDMDRWRAEAQFRLDDYTEIHQYEYDQMEARNTKKIRKSLDALKQIQGKVVHLDAERVDLRVDTVEQSDKISQHWMKTLHGISKEMESLGRTRRAEADTLQDTVHNLSVKLETERELHQEDVSQWKSRVQTAKLDRDETHAHLEVTEDNLRIEFERLEAMGEASHVACQDACKELSFRSEDLAGDVASLTTMIEIAKCKATQLLNRCEALEKDNIKADDNLARTRSECLDTESCLQDSITNYEQLSDQMEQMRTDAHAENERDLSQCKELYDRKMELQRTSHAAESNFHFEESNRLSNVLAKVTSEEKMWSNKLDSQAHQRTLLQRGCAMWKQHYDDAAKTAQKTSEDYKQSKMQWEHTHQELDETRNDSLSRNQCIQQRLQQLTAEIAAYQESSKERTRAESSRAESLQRTYHEAESALEETTKSLKETSNRLQLTHSENARDHSAALQKQNELRREVASTTNQNEEARRAYEDALNQEKATIERLSAQFYRLREENSAEVQRWSEIPQAQINAMEREVDEMTTRDKAELAQLNSQNLATTRELDALTDEYRRQGRLSDEPFQLERGICRVQSGSAFAIDRKCSATDSPTKVNAGRTISSVPKI